MNGPGDLPLTHYSSTPDSNNCSIISIIPTLGMSSCRGRAEAFARRLSSKLRTLGSQTDDEGHSPEDEPIINGDTPNTWVTGHEAEQAVTALQPLRHEADSFFDFDCELESPGSPVDECEYLRLIESASNTPHNSAAESGYACASANSSNSSSDGPFYDVNSETEPSQVTQIKPQKPHLCHSHNVMAHDEVDFVKVATAGAAVAATNTDLAVICNGHDNHVSVQSPATSKKGTESQPISNDIIKTLPSEGPDIETKEISILKQNGGMDACIQEQILQEMRRHSQDVTQEELENKRNSQTEQEPEALTATETTTETATSIKDNEEIQSQVIHTLVNGHAENGEDVLKIEISELKEAELQPKESLLAVVETVATLAESPELRVSTEDAKSNDTTTTEQIKPKSQHLHTSHLDTTDDEDDCRPQRVRRCSSLKTGKTPPGTPGRKKIVRFADVLGLDLADVKTFLDEVPTIPKSAYEDLEIVENDAPIQLGPKSDKLLMPLFQQPGGLTSFLDIVREKQVSLENAAVTDSINHTITGTVRVRNLDFNKSVYIRYSLDGWRSYADLQANYLPNSCDGFSDKFAFVIFGNSLNIGQRLEFAVRFHCKGQQFWDSNYGSNYCFQCLPTSSVPNPSPAMPSHHNSNMVGLLSPTAGEAWCSSFY